MGREIEVGRTQDPGELLSSLPRLVQLISNDEIKVINLLSLLFYLLLKFFSCLCVVCVLCDFIWFGFLICLFIQVPA